MAVLGRKRMQPTRYRLEPWFAFTAHMPRSGRVEGPRPPGFGFPGRADAPAPTTYVKTRRRTVRHPRRSRVPAPPCEKPHPGSCAARQCGPATTGRPATRDRLSPRGYAPGTHRDGVVHPDASEEPRPNITALRGIRAQRPRPHMGGCALGPLARTRLRFNRGPGSAAGVGGVRYTVRGCTSTTIRPTCDIPDVPPRTTRVSLLHAHLVFVTKYRLPVFTDAVLTLLQANDAHRVRRARRRARGVQWRNRHVHLLVARPTTRTISTPVQRAQRGAPPRQCAANSPAPVSRMRGDLVPVLLRLLRMRTAVDHQAIHRRTSPATLTAGPRPPTNGMG